MTDYISKIKEKWDLPTKYFDYLLTNAKEQYIKGENFIDGLRLYGASELIKRQGGYSYDPISNKVFKEWPQDYVVIADDGADPYVLDLSKSNGDDAPILFAYHGEGDWDFREYAESFTKFFTGLKIS